MFNAFRDDGYSLRERRLARFALEAFEPEEPSEPRQPQEPTERQKIIAAGVQELRKNLEGQTGVARTKIVVNFLARHQPADMLANIGMNALEASDMATILNPDNIAANNMAIPSNALVVMRAILMVGPRNARDREDAEKQLRGIADTMTTAGIRIISHPTTHEDAPISYYHALMGLAEACRYFQSRAAINREPNLGQLQRIQKAVEACRKNISALPEDHPLRERLLGSVNIFSGRA
jgi:hypothetical protein